MLMAKQSLLGFWMLSPVPNNTITKQNYLLFAMCCRLLREDESIGNWILNSTGVEFTLLSTKAIHNQVRGEFCFTRLMIK